MRFLRLAKIAAMLLLTFASSSFGQKQNMTARPPDSRSRLVTLRLGEDQIGTIKTAAKLSTRVSFREPVKDVVCGDLYDPTSGTGSFVVQRIDNDVFIKPVSSTGESNMFVKAGDKGEHTYNLSLLIVPPEQAYTIVKVLPAADSVASVRVLGKRVMSPPATVAIGVDDFSVADAKSNSGAHPFSLRIVPVFKELPSPPTTPGNVAVGAQTPIKRVTPQYPDSARRANIFGEVVVRLTIDKSGDVKSVRVISGSPIFRNAAVSAARLWKFTALSDDQPQVQNTYLITFRFQGVDGGTDALLGRSSRR